MSSSSAARSALGICLTGLALLGTVTMPGTVHAKPPASNAAKQPIGVGAISGPQGAKVRSKVMKILRDSGSYEITDVEDVKPGASGGTYKNMASGIGAEAIVVGTVSKAAALTLTVYAANGSKIDSIQLKGGTFPKLYKAIDNELEIAIADPLERAHSGDKAAAAAAPVAADKPAEEEEEDIGPAATAGAAGASDGESSSDQPSDASSGGDEAAAADEPSEKGLRPLEVMLGVRGFNRNFNYTGTPMSPGLQPYNLAFAGAIWGAARIYPGAFWGTGPFSHVGIMARYEFGIPAPTNYTKPVEGGGAIVTELKTKSSEYQLGLRGRVPVGRHELGIFGVFGNQSFVLSGDEQPGKEPYALVPDVHYNFIRVGMDARFYISKLIVGVQVAPRFLTSMKEVDMGGEPAPPTAPATKSTWFPGATGSGFDFGLMLGWQILPWLTPVAGFDVVRYGFDFNNLPAAPPPRVIAGGATDTFVSGYLGVMANFDFSGSASEASVSTETKSTDPEAEEIHLDEEEEKPAPKAKAKAAPPPPKPKAKPKAAAEVEEEEEEEIE